MIAESYSLMSEWVPRNTWNQLLYLGIYATAKPGFLGILVPSSVQCAAYSVQYAVCSVQCELWSVQFVVKSVKLIQCVVCSVIVSRWGKATGNLLVTALTVL